MVTVGDFWTLSRALFGCPVRFWLALKALTTEYQNVYKQSYEYDQEFEISGMVFNFWDFRVANKVDKYSLEFG